jgi:isopenicillin N synthase-like dioxygenase
LKNIPVIDISELLAGKLDSNAAQQIHQACCNHGFFYISGHGVSLELQDKLMELSKAFFALPEKEKMEISMDKGGRAWRGFFPVGAELTSGKPDIKEGIYFGSELDVNHPRAKAGIPLHGQNLFPKNPSEFKSTILKWMEEVEKVGHAVMRGIALSLGLSFDYFDKYYTHKPLILFRIFHYPATDVPLDTWGVGEHTDYGLLTILKQDNNGGLQVKSKGSWIEAPPIPNTFVCNIGDMLDYITGGLYKSTPHRVRNISGKSRFSFPLFFDPDFEAEIHKIAGLKIDVVDDSNERWDQSNIHDFKGTYGAYLFSKVSKVFPQLKDQILSKENI